MYALTPVKIVQTSYIVVAAVHKFRHGFMSGEGSCKGWGMAALLGGYEASSPGEDAGAPPVSGCHAMETSDGQKDGKEVMWQVKIELQGDLVSRKVWRGEETLEKGLDGWEPEGLIWPTWPGRSQEEFAASVLPLTAVEEYWSGAGKRLRDSAKWMATVLGAALAVIVGTSPLSEMTQRINHPTTLAAVSAGLLFLFVTLFLVIQVMRPQSVSFTDVQFATENCGFWKRVFYGNALYKWQTIIEREPDLHLPCGVRSLTALRQAMIIEEIT